MTMKLFVGAMSTSTDENLLRQGFGSFGVVLEVKVVVDRATGRSRGFGFVTMVNGAAGAAAIDGMNHRELDGRPLHVCEARDLRTDVDTGAQVSGYSPRTSRGDEQHEKA